MLRRHAMHSYDEALKLVLENIPVLGIEEKEPFRCSGQVLAEDIFAEVGLPVRDCAIQDGYAVKASDVQSAGKSSPVTLRGVETVRAGSLPVHQVEPGTAIRIMTGSILPEGADCVIPFEASDEPDNKEGASPVIPAVTRIFMAAKAGSSVRKSGTNIARGQKIIAQGTVIGPNHISILMYAGRGRIKVIRRPVAAVISTGDELVSPGRPLSPEKTYNCNSAAIGAMINHYGGVPQILGVARDYETSILAKIRHGSNCDVIITSGGVSKGDYDLVKRVINSIGVVKLSRIKMGPGASFTFGLIDKLVKSQTIPFFGLAGPPVGCMVNFETLVRPAMLKMRGFNNLSHSAVEAVADEDFQVKRLMAFVKWTVLRKENGEFHVRLNDSEPGGEMLSVVKANSLTIIPEGGKIHKGDKVKVYPFNWYSDQDAFSWPNL
jgi:molybdopterin molybdotransferase